jgi:hypothetical protein
MSQQTEFQVMIFEEVEVLDGLDSLGCSVLGFFLHQIIFSHWHS